MAVATLDPRIHDLRGERFGLLLVQEFAGIRERKAYWRCVCECGRSVVVRGTRMVSGRQFSCGCWRASSEVRRAARLQVPEKRRREIARMGGAASVAARRATVV